MKTRCSSLCVLAFFFTLTPFVHAQNMNATGAGTADVNGIYVVAGTNDGVNYYQKGSIYLYRCINTGTWMISAVINTPWLADLYYLSGDPSDTPDGMTFTQSGDLGSLPGPTINETSLPVGLSSFSARCEGQAIVLEWVTESEVDNLGFILERTMDSESWVTIASYQTHDALKGRGNTSSRTVYTFSDNGVESGKEYLYRLSDVSTEGKMTQYAPLSIKLDALPEITTMEKAYPNPFNPQTHIAYHLAETARVKITICDMLGRSVKELYNGQQPAGSYHVYWNGTNENGMKASSGVYILRMQTENILQIQKVMFLK